MTKEEFITGKPFTYTKFGKTLFKFKSDGSIIINANNNKFEVDVETIHDNYIEIKIGYLGTFRCIMIDLNILILYEKV